MLADQFSDNALSVHNSNRAHYGANPLKYDNNLAAGAASYAGQCQFKHSRLVHSSSLSPLMYLVTISL
jgi:uncharacterized protein YkwD